jgi:sterol desaturase/sphingolipid hydroxylase (fatty acid hydroxylase superfamily)
MLLEAETKLVRDKSLGYLVTTEETPIEKWSPFTLLMRVVSVSLSTLLLIGLPIFAVLSAILSALGTWIPSTLASGIPPIAMAFSGLLGGLSMLLWYYWY